MSIPSFHDGHLNGIVLRPNQQCLLLLSDVTGAEYQFILDGVEHFRAENFRQGNIVLDLTVRDQNVDEEDLLFVLFLDRPPDSKKGIESNLSRIQSGELHLIQLAPSYGCELAILCRGYKLELIT